MKFNINKITIVTVITVLIFAFSACNNQKDGNGQNQEAKEIQREEPEEEVPTIATLSEEQLKIVGIKIGTIEQRELSATIKANGNNMATFGGFFYGILRAFVS